MGHGIAQVFARHGHAVRLHDPAPSVLAGVHDRIRANLADLGEPTDCLERISTHRALDEAVAVADLVIEAAPEKLEIKRALFRDLVQVSLTTAILASNTSVIPIGAISEGLPTAERILGTHWWNPPFLVPLVEVVGTPATSPAHLAWVIDLLAAVGKTPVLVRKDVPGFVGNRLQHALWREAIALVAEGVCDAETVDTVVKASFGRRLAVLGPLENADLVGTDLTLDIHKVVLPHLDRSPDPSPYLRRLVAEGRLGQKSGEGFRRWRDGQAAELRQRVFRHLKTGNAATDGTGGNHDGIERDGP
jgi:3-hydroxybutyryl-CoA dehydrogenase